MTPSLTRRLFDIGVIVKGVDGALQTLVGLLLAFNSAAVDDWIWLWISHLPPWSSADLLATLLYKLSQWLSTDARGFAVYYLISHGVIKVFLAIQLLREKMWAFPVGIVVFGSFVAYQLHRYTFTHSIAILFFSLLDIVVIVLIAREWRLRAHGEPEPHWR